MTSREPVLLQKRKWVEATTLGVIGVDPGFASMGLAALSQTLPHPVRCNFLSVASTKKASKKLRRLLRVADDDQRRIRDLYYALAQAEAAWDVHAIAYEVYAPFKGRMGGNAWKAARVEGLVQGFGLGKELLVLPFLPQDVKRAFCGQVQASKEDVIAAMRKKLAGFNELIDQIPEGDREHAADAAGHAYLAFEEMYRMRQMTGLG